MIFHIVKNYRFIDEKCIGKYFGYLKMRRMHFDISYSSYVDDTITKLAFIVKKVHFLATALSIILLVVHLTTIQLFRLMCVVVYNNDCTLGTKRFDLLFIIYAKKSKEIVKMRCTKS